MTPTFLLPSRLGLLHQPQGQSDPNVGVEDAPQAIITPEFSAELSLEPQQSEFSLPEEVTAENYYQVFSKETAISKNQIAEALKKSTDHQPVSLAVGGDHSVSLAHISALLETVASPNKTGILMFDSHADINLVKTSDTGNIHGMWLRPIVSLFDQLEIDALVPQKVSPQNLVYIGNQNLDPAEKEFIDILRCR